ncbi:DUF6498-containing protein [Thiolapillus sp.]
MQISAGRLERLFSDNSVWGLLLANLLTIVMAVMQDWSLLLVMWVYWCQSVIIGLFNFWRMMTLKRFSTKGVSSSDGPVLATRKTKWEMSWFFLIHYGMFHAGYLVFLFSGVTGEQPPFFSLGPLLMVLLFFINHAWSFFHNRRREANSTPNIGTLMFLPYARILPMHLTLVFGGMFISGKLWLVFFLLLKTLADLIAHAVEHAVRRKSADADQAEPSF